MKLLSYRSVWITICLLKFSSVSIKSSVFVRCLWNIIQHISHFLKTFVRKSTCKIAECIQCSGCGFRSAGGVQAASSRGLRRGRETVKCRAGRMSLQETRAQSAALRFPDSVVVVSWIICVCLRVSSAVRLSVCSRRSVYSHSFVQSPTESTPIAPYVNVQSGWSWSWSWGPPTSVQ